MKPSEVRCNFGSSLKTSSERKSWELSFNRRKLLLPLLPPFHSESSTETNKLSLCKWSRKPSERGRRIGHTRSRSLGICFYPSLYRNSTPLFPFSLLLSLSFSLSGELRDGDLFKGHLNHLSYLRVSSLRWRAQQRNFASGFSFVHFKTSRQEPQ